MTATTEPSAVASVIATALLEVAGQCSSHRRFYLRTHLGATPAEIFAALEPRLTEQVLVGPGRGRLLAGAPVGGVTLLPYLVDGQTAGSNRGVQGYAATLRTDFTAHVRPDERRVLLILDEKPFETVLSAAEDAAGLRQLSWKALLARVAAIAAGPAAALVADIAEDLGPLPASTRSAGLLGRFAWFASQQWATIADAGDQLPKLGIYLRDQTPTLARLHQSRDWRRDLEVWRLPDKDLTVELNRYAGEDSPGVRRIIAARGVHGFEWSAFTLDDLPPRKSTSRAVLIRPAALIGVRSSIASAASAACWLTVNSDGAIGIRFRGSAAGLTPHVRWSGGERVACAIDEAAMIVNLRAPYPATATPALPGGEPAPGWVFGELELRRNETLRLGVYRGSGTWFAAEASLNIDAVAGGFIAPDPLQLLAIGDSDVVLGTATYTPATDSDPSEVVAAFATFGDEQCVVPLLIQNVVDDTPSAEDTPDDAGDDREADDRAAHDDPDEPGDYPGGAYPELTDHDDKQDDEDGRAAGDLMESGTHALLALAAARATDGLTLSEPMRFIPGNTPIFSGAGTRYGLANQNLTDELDGLQLERIILSQPETLAFSVSRDSSTTTLQPDAPLERLALDSLDQRSIREFLTARTALFSALRPAGSVHALLCGEARKEAAVYVEAYKQILMSIPVPGPYAPEYDRLLLCDLVSDPTTGRCWLAPTNPLTVAWALEAEQTGLTWAQQSAQLPARDIAAIRPTYLLPLMHSAGTWWETDPRSPLLWRAYRQLGSSIALGSGGDKTITRRLEKFLGIFPTYKDPRQRLAVALHEPGDGGSVAIALRRFYQAESKPGAEATLPQLDIKVYNDDAQMPEELARLAAPHNDADHDRLVRSRITLSAVHSDDEKTFAHLSFVFRAPAARKPRTVEIDARCPTDWVGGLATATGRTARLAVNEMVFTSGLFVSAQNASTLTTMLSRTLEMVGGQPDQHLHPGSTRATATTVKPDSLIDIYSSSVWTTHADQLLGPETFSPALRGPLTIVDFDDRSGFWHAGIDSITVTERVEPYRTALSRAFAPEASLQEPALEGLIHLGNAVSGRWNLDLLSQSVNGVRERIGILAAIAALRDLDGAFEPASSPGDVGGVLLPLQELFKLLPASGHPRPSGRSCDDLLYLRIHAVQNGHVCLNARLLEVKFASKAMPDLKIARRELETTRKWLSDVFNVRTPSQLFRARDLAEFIRASAARNTSFGLHGIPAHQVERVTAIIAAGNFTLDMSYTVGHETLAGDVVSLELQNTTAAARLPLPGGMPAMGYIRLGREAMEQLASEAKLQRPPGWQTPEYPAPPAPSAPAGRGGAALTPAAGAPTANPPGGPAGTSAPPAGTAPTDGANPASPLPPSTSDADGHKGDKTATPSSGTVAERADDSIADQHKPHGETGKSRQVAAEVAGKAVELDDAAAKYGLQLAPFDRALAQVGPSVIRFRTRLLGKQTIAGVRTKAMDIGREIGIAEGVLVDQEPYYVTIDVPRSEREVVPLAAHISKLSSSQEPGALPFLLGMAPSGEVVVEDLARLPHLLVAGATGSGKSVLLRGLLCCLARTRTPTQLQILLVDPKQVDFLPFEGMPHLVDNRIITDPAESIQVLEDTLSREVTWRRQTLKQSGATSALEFYERGGSLEELPQMVILVDEFADLGASLSRRDRQAFMQLIQRFGQLTRAFGIYLVLATQRPSVQVINGDIKANLTARVALKVQSAFDSQTILGRGGAEALRDRGDLLFDHGGTTRRLQGFYTELNDISEALSL